MFLKMLILQVLVLFIFRIIAKRKFRIRGHIKWVSLVDIILIQESKDPIYWCAWVLWCMWWDIFDREHYKMAGFLGYTITCLRILWVLKTNTFIYIPCAVTSAAMTYNALYRAFF